MSFFVLGLPRSRTAWLANFLTYDGNYCYHEGLNGCRSVDQYKRKVAGKGDACTGLMLIDIQRHFPTSPKLIIEREVGDVIDWCNKTYGVNSELQITTMAAKLEGIPGLRVPFEEIDDRLDEIWEYLIGSPFDKERADILLNMNIQEKNIDRYDVGAAQELLQAVH